MTADIVELLEDALARTAGNTRDHARGRAQLRLAAGDRPRRGGRRPPRARVTAEAIAAELDTADLPPLDLLIRTSGEVRLSNFLLWQAAYAEMWFTDVLWPDFTPAHLEEALAAFASRERRYGGR